MSAVRIVGYVRVSTEDQGDSRAGLEAQRSAITSNARARGWQMIGVEQDIASGRTTTKRPGLAAALAAVQAHTADALVVAKLDRLSRSLLDFAAIVEQSRQQSTRRLRSARSPCSATLGMPLSMIGRRAAKVLRSKLL